MKISKIKHFGQNILTSHSFNRRDNSKFMLFFFTQCVVGDQAASVSHAAGAPTVIAVVFVTNGCNSHHHYLPRHYRDLGCVRAGHWHRDHPRLDSLSLSMTEYALGGGKTVGRVENLPLAGCLLSLNSRVYPWHEFIPPPPLQICISCEFILCPLPKWLPLWQDEKRSCM